MCSGCRRGGGVFVLSRGERQSGRLTTIIAPTATQPIATLSIHNRSACLAHSRRFRSTRRKRGRRTIGRAVAIPNLASVGAAVEKLAFDVVLGTAMSASTAASVVVPWHVGSSGRHASAGTRDAADSVAADVDIWDCRDIRGRSGGQRWAGG